MIANQSLKASLDEAVPAPAPAPGAHRVESRFGTIEIAPDSVLHLPNGVLGFSEYREFGLARLPEGRHPQFRVLQSMATPDLAFLVAPMNMESGAIDEGDLAEASETLGIPRKSLAVLLIVTVRRDDAGAHVSVNMRAPLFVDIDRRTARQYVLPNGKYSIRQAL